jgi:hypothetical protein
VKSRKESVNDMKKIIAALVVGAAVGSLFTHLYTPAQTRGERWAAYEKEQDKKRGPVALAERFMTKAFNVRPGDIQITYDFTNTPVTATATAPTSLGGAEYTCKWGMKQVANEIWPEYGWTTVSRGCTPNKSA